MEERYLQKLFEDSCVIHTKSKERVKVLGEVFTPPHIANQMLDLLDPSTFADPEKVLFEPCCGTGNILLEMIKRRLEASYVEFQKDGRENPEKWAIAFCAQTTYACDIDLENVNECRSRVKQLYSQWFYEKTGVSVFVLGKKTFAPIFNLVDENIEHADMLSGLEVDFDKAYDSAKKVKTSHEFFKQYGHRVLKVIRDVQDSRFEDLL